MNDDRNIAGDDLDREIRNFFTHEAKQQVAYSEIAFDVRSRVRKRMRRRKIIQSAAFAIIIIAALLGYNSSSKFSLSILPTQLSAIGLIDPQIAYPEDHKSHEPEGNTSEVPPIRKEITLFPLFQFTENAAFGKRGGDPADRANQSSEPLQCGNLVILKKAQLTYQTCVDSSSIGWQVVMHATNTGTTISRSSFDLALYADDFSSMYARDTQKISLAVPPGRTVSLASKQYAPTDLCISITGTLASTVSNGNAIEGPLAYAGLCDGTQRSR